MDETSSLCSGSRFSHGDAEGSWSLPGPDVGKPMASHNSRRARGGTARNTLAMATSKRAKNNVASAATARKKRDLETPKLLGLPHEWEDFKYQGKTNIFATSSSPLMSFFTRLGGTPAAPMSTGDDTAEPLASSFPGTCLAAPTGSPAADDQACQRCEEGAPQAVRGQESASGDRESKDRSMPRATETPGHTTTEGTTIKREAAAKETAAQWNKILCMKKPDIARNVSAPSYLSEKEQKAFLATAANAPLCKGHGEPAIQRVTQKPGPNLGRRFWVCARPNGAAGVAAARCDFFKWC